MEQNFSATKFALEVVCDEYILTVERANIILFFCRTGSEACEVCKDLEFRLSEEHESTRGSFVWVQSGGARISKVPEVSAVSEVLECLKRARKLGARGYMALQGLITRVFPR